MKKMMDELNEYISLRRALGAKLEGPDRALRNFVTFLEDREAPHVTIPLTLEWATLPARTSKIYQAHRLSQARLFARFLQAKDSRHEVAPMGMIQAKARRAKPYLYSADEVHSIIDVARALPPHPEVRGKGIRGETCSTVFGLLAVTGMRVSEVLRLDRTDVDLDNGILTIRWTKFNKTRLIPVHSSTRVVLQTYAKRRDALVSKALSKAFFRTDRGTRVNDVVLRYSFRQVSRRIGLRGSNDRKGPRLHDLRHRFAVETILTWYRQGIDAERLLPVLATYLGHVHVSCCYWYIEAVPELLELAVSRMEERHRRES